MTLEIRATASPADGIVLRALQASDLEAAQALSLAAHWPHRLADWEHALRFGEGVAAGRDGALAGIALRWRWGEAHATVGLVIVDPRWRGRHVGWRLVQALLAGLEDRTVLLHATPEGRSLYERLGFARAGEVRQHQGIALPAPLVALAAGWRLRPSDHNDAPALAALDARARGMPRDALIADLVAHEHTVVLDHAGEVRGFAVLRRFGRGLAIGPVVAPDDAGAQALIAHLAGLNAGRFVRIDVDAGTGLSGWLEGLGLACADAPTVMRRDARGPASTAVASTAVASRAGATTAGATTAGTATASAATASAADATAADGASAAAASTAAASAPTADAPAAGAPRLYALVSQALG